MINADLPWINQIMNYSVTDGIFTSVDWNISEGNAACNALGKKALVDSQISCWLFQLPFFLENWEFGYFCLFLTFSITLISIFGNIKQSYKWFMLNQSIWDFFIVYNFICEKPSWSTWFKWPYQWYLTYYPDNVSSFDSIHQGPSTCFYSIPLDDESQNNYFNHIYSMFFYFSARNASYSPLFLLTFSRFIGLYFHRFYEKFFTPIKITLIIFGFNSFCIIMVNLDEWYKIFSKLIIRNDYFKCIKDSCGDDGICFSGYCNIYYFFLTDKPQLKG